MTLGRRGGSAAAAYWTTSVVLPYPTDAVTNTRGAVDSTIRPISSARTTRPGRFPRRASFVSTTNGRSAIVASAHRDRVYDQLRGEETAGSCVA
jgi:hypothetical protein